MTKGQARNKPKGWVKEPVRHGLAAKGIKTVDTARFGSVRDSVREGPHATPTQAKKIVSQFLNENDIPYTKLRARTIGFADLARDEMVFVKIFGWKPNPAIEELEAIGRKMGFRVETDWMFS